MSKMTTKASLAHMEMKVFAAKMENMVISYAGGVGARVWVGVPPDRRRASQKNREDNGVKWLPVWRSCSIFSTSAATFSDGVI